MEAVLGGLGLDIALKYRDYLLTKGFPPSHEVKESDLTEDQIRNLRNDHLQTLCKWKKISSDEAMPTKKADLAARLIATMGCPRTLVHTIQKMKRTTKATLL